MVIFYFVLICYFLFGLWLALLQNQDPAGLSAGVQVFILTAHVSPG